VVSLLVPGLCGGGHDAVSMRGVHHSH
jgi:hypothetical protein